MIKRYRLFLEVQHHPVEAVENSAQVQDTQKLCVSLGLSAQNNTCICPGPLRHLSEQLFPSFPSWAPAPTLQSQGLSGNFHHSPVGAFFDFSACGLPLLSSPTAPLLFGTKLGPMVDARESSWEKLRKNRPDFLFILEMTWGKGRTFSPRLRQEVALQDSGKWPCSECTLVRSKGSTGLEVIGSE